MKKISNLSPPIRHTINVLVIVGSIILCLLLLPTRLPGMEIVGINPNWLLIWVVTWSVNRTAFQGGVAGLALGMIQDGMTSPHPTHALSLMLVGIFTARIQKQRYIQEDFISVALIVFGMAILAETVIAIQYLLLGNIANADSFAVRNWAETWTDYQRIALSSAILSSLWAPVVYYPLHRWWKEMKVF
ncbi:MAG: rod shape-determining protein MreD [Chamaesiphon sp.]